MKHFILSLLCFFTLAAPAFAGNDEKESAFDRVMRTGILRCAYAPSGKYAYKDMTTGELKGAVVDIATALAESLNLKIEWAAEVGYADFAEGLKTGRYDAFCGIMTEAPTRARVAAFTSPLFYLAYYAWGREDESRFKSIDDINKPEISTAAIDGEVFQLIARKHFPATKEYSLPNMTEPSLVYTSVADGKADALVHDSWNIALYNASNPKKLKKLLDKPLELYAAGFSVAPGQQDLLNALNTGIMSLHNLGKIDDILNKWGVDSSIIYRVAKPYETVK